VDTAGRGGGVEDRTAVGYGEASAGVPGFLKHYSGV